MKMSQIANAQSDVLKCLNLSKQPTTQNLPFPITLKRQKQQILILQNLAAEYVFLLKTSGYLNSFSVVQQSD